MRGECRLCPRECGVRRDRGETGFCGATDIVEIASMGPHFGEEPPLVGTRGSGTVFFNHCNLKCVFCQNNDISTRGGRKISVPDLARLFMDIQAAGCHNLNLVTPTHYALRIAEALELAREKGFRLPVVYNCGGYESLETLAQLDGVVDIYMPDLKTLDEAWAGAYLHASDYPAVAAAALREMFRQVGNLVCDENGTARKGLLIRHLVMPGQTEDAHRVVDFVYDLCGDRAYLNIMAQYRPCHLAFRHPDLARRITDEEWRVVVEYALGRGLDRGIEGWRRREPPERKGRS